MRIPQALLLSALALSSPLLAQQTVELQPVLIVLPEELAPGDWGDALLLELEGIRPQGQGLHLQLTRVSSRSADFKLFTWDERGGYQEHPVPPVSSYFGHVLGSPQSTVFASLDSTGLHARINWASGEAWQVDPLDGAAAGRLVGWHGVDFDVRDTVFQEGGCGVDLDPVIDEGPPAPVLPQRSSLETSSMGGSLGVTVSGPIGGANSAAALPVPACMSTAEIGFDADYEYYLLKNGSVADTLSAIDLILAQVNYFYARDVRIQHELTHVVVRTSLFYTPTGGGDLLDQFRVEWNTNLASVPRDMAHLMTDKSGIQYGGLAWVSAVCNSYSYGWSLDSAGIVGHELGHNWGSGHCNDSTPCNNMCGACLYIAPKTRDIISAYRDTRPCLEQGRSFALGLPPYAYPEFFAMDMSRLQAEGPFLIDVLANDDDGNCEGVYMPSFDSTTPRGGTLTRAAGAGTAGRDALWYHPPAVPFVGEDVFSYTVADLGGLQTDGAVTVTSREERMQAYWPFDEGVGVTIADATGQGHDGVATQSGNWVAGVAGTALRFDGLGQQVAVASATYPGDWSYAAWVKRLPGAGPAASLMESANGSLRLEQWWNTGLLGVTRYSWYDGTYPYAAPMGQWVHLVFTGSEGQTTLYIDGVQSGSVALEIEGPLGDMAAGGGLAADLDEVRVYDYALDAAAIGALAQGGGRAENPKPGMNGSEVFDPVPLSWIGHAQATEQRVFLGTDYAAVVAATMASPEYQGSTQAWSWNAAGLVRGQTYFWRVDEVVSGNAFPGETWTFDFERSLHWALDDVSGSVALESLEGHNGSYTGGVLLGQPGATPVLGSSIWLDGVNDRVLMPALNLNDNHATFTAWIRRSGNQSDWSGLMFSRAGSTAAGLNIGYNNGLRYHWNGGHWGFDSGLVVPDGEWVFVALTIAPLEARIYLGQGGVLSSAVSSSAHAPEEFDSSFVLGRDPLYSSRRFRGNMDDVQFFRATLSAEEIAQLYADSQ